jgi:uncharacterized repeat protein (TIGR01451 family)
MRRNLLTRNFIRCGVLMALFGLLFMSQTAYALLGWTYRVPITITNGSGLTRTDYQVLIELDTQVLIAQGKMRADGGDIRFSTDSDGTTLIDYWIESGINTTNTRIWVRVPSLPASSAVTIYMFYGNPGAASQSSFATTFPNRYELTSGSDTLGGVQTYDWFQVSSGATLNVQDGQVLTVQAGVIRIEGAVDGNGAGYDGSRTSPSTNGSGPGFGYGSSANGGGAGYGGQGGCAPASGANSCAAPRGASYGASGMSIDMGSGGGSGQHSPPNDQGGDGGGAVWLQAKVIEVAGLIQVNGEDGVASQASSYVGGGGSGGGILLQGDQVNLAGATLSARGGRAGNRFGGAGGGGRVKIFYDSSLSGAYTRDVAGETTHTYGGTVKLDTARGQSGAVLVSTFTSTEPTVSIGSETVFGDLSITKTAAPSVVEPGQPLTYTLTFSNVGSTTATGVLITDTLPAVLTHPGFVSSGATITRTDGITYAWQVQDLAPGQGGVITITGVLSAGLPAGTFGNTATITTTTMEDSYTIDNSSTAEVTIDNVAPVLADATRSIAEDAANGDNVGTPVTGTDANNDVLSYAITAGNDDGVFAMDSSTGQITIMDNTNLDYETKPNYLLTVQVSDGTLFDTAVVTVDVTNVNDAPINSVPGAQNAGKGEELIFSSSNGNQVSISDADAGGNPVKVTLKVTHGLLTLNGTTGLTFSVGDGAADPMMVFVGTIAHINSALNGMRFVSDADYEGPASLQISTDDQGYSGPGGPQSSTDTVDITVGGGTGPMILYLPMVFRSLVSAPDLVVESIVVVSNDVQVVIVNQGDASVVEDFWVDLYIDPEPIPTAVNQTWPQLCDEGLTWGVTEDLAPGATLILTLSSPYFNADYSNFGGTFTDGMDIYVQVDSANADTIYGAVLESHESTGEAYNNIEHVTVSIAAVDGVTVPVFENQVLPSGNLPPRP